MSASFGAWLDACRPKTLPLACLAIVTGNALALAQGYFSTAVLLLSLLTAALLQVLSNLANDYGDGLRGVDNAQRLGPVRALQSGALSAGQLRNALVLVALLTLASGLGLLSLAQLTASDWLWFLLLGALALVAALSYTLGQRPYGYAGLGDLAVWLFFGLLGVLGSCHLQGTVFSPWLLLPACASGLLAVAVLNINNMRDIDNDARHGKRTLAVRLGLTTARRYHYALLLLAWLLFAVYLPIATASPWSHVLFITAAWPLWRMARAVQQAKDSAAMAPLLPRMVGCASLVGLLFILVLLLPLLINP